MNELGWNNEHKRRVQEWAENLHGPLRLSVEAALTEIDRQEEEIIELASEVNELASDRIGIIFANAAEVQQLKARLAGRDTKTEYENQSADDQKKEIANLKSRMDVASDLRVIADQQLGERINELETRFNRLIDKISRGNDGG